MLPGVQAWASNGPFNGAISGLVDGDTCFTYTPGFNWNGTDSVDVLVCDDNGGCDTLAVTIIVLPVNDPPIITDGGPPADTILVNIQPDTPTEICLEAIDFDGDSLDVVSVINGPDSGAVNGVRDGDTCFTYTPNNGFVGSDTLTAVVGDGNGGSDTVVVVIGVFPNEPPVAAPDTLYVTVAEDGSVEPCPQATDADGDPLQVTGVVDLPAWGSASGFNDGDTCFFYFPTPDNNGGDTLSVLVCDPLHYSTLPFPFHEMQTPAFSMNYNWSLHDLVGLLNTWSAVQHYIRQYHANPVEEVRKKLSAIWIDKEKKPVFFPLIIRLGHLGLLQNT